MSQTNSQQPSRFRSLQFHKSYLIVSAIVIGAFGPIFSLGSMPPTSEPARWTLDLLSWPLDGEQTYAEPTTRFLSALTGAFLLAWGVMVLFLRKYVFDHAPEGLRKSLQYSVWIWFVLDSGGSIASGNASNALVNIVVLLGAIGPFWWPAQDHQGA